MQVQSFILNITSEQPEAMIAFYRDVLHLPLNPAVGEGAFQAGGATLIFDGHSQTKGTAREPQRCLIDFTVEDLMAEKARREAAGARFIREPAREYWGGLISTFLDPDGNYLQLIEMPKR
jgi:predicted enzyme related to lactoylglutathione lyase